jgi:hypothetical protein
VCADGSVASFDCSGNAEKTAGRPTHGVSVSDANTRARNDSSAVVASEVGSMKQLRLPGLPLGYELSFLPSTKVETKVLTFARREA